MPTVFITGAAGGLGREFARQYADAGWKVIAPLRTQMDVADQQSIDSYVAGLDPEPVDLLIHNAGMRNAEPSGSRLGEFTLPGWLPTLVTNVVGPALVTQALLARMRCGSGKKIIILSSRLGSFAAGGGNNTGGGGSSYYAYRVSKSAVNQLGRCLSIDLGPEGFVCTLMDPGWVRTPMGGERASLLPAESVARMRALIERLDAEHNGRFLTLDGQDVPW